MTAEAPDARTRLIAELRDQAEYHAERGEPSQSSLERLPDLLREAADALAAEEWRDIETAPKDGTEVLVWGGRYGTRGPVIAHFMRQAPEDHPPIDPGWYFWQPHTATRYGTFIQLDTPPTHWRPLPAPPDRSRP